MAHVPELPGRVALGGSVSGVTSWGVLFLAWTLARGVYQVIDIRLDRPGTLGPSARHLARMRPRRLSAYRRRGTSTS